MNDINEWVEGLDEDALENLTYYLGIRQSKRRTAGLSPNRFGNEKPILTLDRPKVDKDTPSSFPEDLNNVDAGNWLNACKFEIDSLHRLEMRDLVRVP